MFYDFHYDYIKNKYNSNSRLLFKDYYSSSLPKSLTKLLNEHLMYKIKIEDVYEDFSKDKEMFDFSIILLGQNIMTIKQISCW